MVEPSLSTDQLELLLRLKAEIETGPLSSYLTMHVPRLVHKNYNKTPRSPRSRSNTTRKGGGLDKKMITLVIVAIAFIISFSVTSNQARDYFEIMLLQPSIYWETVLVPFLNKLKTGNDRNSLAFVLFGQYVHSIMIPTLKGVYKKLMESISGDPLALNGLWSLWTNMIKFKDALIEPKNKTEITPEKMREIYEAGLKDIERIVFYVTAPKDFKLYSLPYGSKLITNKSICN
jgi:hypothetical protein